MINFGALLGDYNAFGSSQTVAFKQIEEYGKDFCITLLSLAALDLAYRYKEQECNPWDERDKKAKEYSYENEDFFKNLYREYSMKEFPKDIEKGQGVLSRAIRCEKDLISKEMLDWLRAFENEHPTIRQSFFRGMVRALQNDMYLPDASFPLI